MAPVVSTNGPGVNLPVCKDNQEVRMSDEKKVKLEVPKNLMVVLWLIAGGLFANSLQFLTVESVSAQSGVTRVAICNAGGGVCADVAKDGPWYSLMTSRNPY